MSQAITIHESTYRQMKHGP